MQVEGVRWLYAAVHGGGGILADEPGLGKTLQVITVLEALVASGYVRRVLIVTPSNLLANWYAVRCTVSASDPPALSDDRDLSSRNAGVWQVAWRLAARAQRVHAQEDGGQSDNGGRSSSPRLDARAEALCDAHLL